MKRIAFITLGCAKNEVDTARMARELVGAGYGICTDASDADVVVVNTCSFIQSATEESIEAVLEAADLPLVKEGRAFLVVAGCMPARYGAELEQEIPEARSFVPCSKEDDIVEVVAGLVGPSTRDDHLDWHDTLDVDGGTGEGAPFAYVKISDGCDRFCAYCTIPYIRGRYHSFSYEHIRSEVAARIKEGAREICLIAQDTGRWGSEFDGTGPSTLAQLMAALADEFSETWFRVLYLQPEGITDELLDVMARCNNICSYLDIPLQHVNADMLKAMNRKGSRPEIEEVLRRVRDRIPDITLRTTLIAGFPGETEEQHEEMCEFIQDAEFDYVGVFAYSREDGTRAAELPHQLDEDEKTYRAQKVRDLADAVSTSLIASRVGQNIRVLIEGTEEDGQLFGRAMCQAPEVDGSCYIDKGSVGDIVEVRIVDTMFYEMEGEVQ